MFVPVAGAVGSVVSVCECVCVCVCVCVCIHVLQRDVQFDVLDLGCGFV